MGRNNLQDRRNVGRCSMTPDEAPPPNADDAALDELRASFLEASKGYHSLIYWALANVPVLIGMIRDAQSKAKP